MNIPLNDSVDLDVIMRVDNLPSKGRRLKIQASEAQNKEIAKHLKIDGVEKFYAKLLAKPIKSGFIVSGELKATISQQSVVTFEPVIQHIEEDLKRLFLQGNRDETHNGAGSEGFIDLEGGDLPDYYNETEIDFSNYLLEVLALAIDLFPKNAGEKIELAKNGDENEKPSPFAKLKNLKLN
ncbi:MAG: DUF177 domain-containing protein [Devosiaceae bacterium]|nr:DUF177 domain-containing protein [Devosiaceae bacterium]